MKEGTQDHSFTMSLEIHEVASLTNGSSVEVPTWRTLDFGTGRSELSVDSTKLLVGQFVRDYRKANSKSPKMSE